MNSDKLANCLFRPTVVIEVILLIVVTALISTSLIFFSLRYGQFILPGKSKHLNLLSFLYNSLELNLIIVLGYLSIILLTGLLPNLIHPNYNRLKSLRLMSIQMFFLPHDHLPKLSRKLAVLMLFFNCFFFIASNFLSGTIKTESVLVDTDELITSSFKLLNSKKTFVTNPADEIVLRRLPTNSPLKKLSEKKLAEKKYYVIDYKTLGQFFENGMSSYYFVSKYIGVVWKLWALAPLDSSGNMVVFMTQKKYHEWLTVYIFRKSLDEQRKRFIRRRYVRRGFQIPRTFENLIFN